MSKLIASSRGRIFISYRQFYLIDAGIGGLPGRASYAANGLVVTAPGVAVFLCGTHTGEALLELQALDAPPELAIDDWDDVIEVSLEAPSGELKIQGIIESGPDDFPVASPAGQGWYRVRAHVRGRDAQAATSGDATTSEEFLLQVWPAPEREQNIIKATDQLGARKRSK